MLPPTCCPTTFLVVALLAMGCSIASLWLPLFVMVPSHGPNESSESSPHFLLVSFLGTQHSSASVATAAEHSASHRTFRQQHLPLPNNSVQCPYFNGPCWNGDTPITPYGTTDDLLRSAGCDSLGSPADITSTRFWSIGATALSLATVVAAIVHVCKGGTFGSNAAFHKFGAAGVAFGHVVTAAMAIGREEPTTTCIETSIVNVVNLPPQQYNIIMLSLIMTLIAGGLQFLNSIGMLLSWWLPCCGSPAGRAGKVDNDAVTSLLADDTREESLYGGDTDDPDYRAYRSQIQANISNNPSNTGSGYPGYSD
jgi:hypothetical protein